MATANRRWRGNRRRTGFGIPVRPNVRRRLSRICFPVALIALAASASKAFAQPPISSVTSCQTLAKSGAYELDNAISAGAAGDCIVISAPNVTLNLDQFSITGAGGRAGIHVLRTAANAFIEGGGATISGFVAGIEIDAPNAVAENFTVSNDGEGVLLNGAKQAKLSNFSANGNQSDGVKLLKATMNVLQGFSAENNGRYGVWLIASSRNTISGGGASFDTRDNSVAGIYLGCWSDGPHGQACKPKMAPSAYNYIFDGAAYATSGGAQRYGIAIDLGDNFNKIANVTSQYNTSADPPYSDVVDENPDCGNNLWIAVVYGTPSPPPACIH